MKKSLFAVPALAMLLGIGGSATAYAKSPDASVPNHTDGQPDVRETLKDLLHAGKIDEARAFAEAHGLSSLRHGQQRPEFDSAKHQAIEAALANGDYDTFAQLTADAPFADELTPEAFSQLVEAHTLMEAGDMDGAKAILKDLGFPIPGQPPGHGPWQQELTTEQKDLLDQARKLHQSGDDEGAQAILDSLDLPRPPVRAFTR